MFIIDTLFEQGVGIIKMSKPTAPWTWADEYAPLQIHI